VKKPILTILMILPFLGLAHEVPDPAEDVDIPPLQIDFSEDETPEPEEEGKWKTAGMVLLSIAMVTVGLVVASSNNGNSQKN